MRSSHDSVCGCFPTGRHYPGIAERIAGAVVDVTGLAPEFPAATHWMTASFAVIDFETTGLDPAQDRILEVGVVCFDAGAAGETHNWLVNPQIPVPEEARKIHGISDADLRDAPAFEDILPTLITLLEGRLPVAYNADFDRRFLHAEFGRAGGAAEGAVPPALRPDVDWIDPLVWVRELQKYEKGKKLTDVAQRMGISLENAHRAADDATATGQVLLRLGKDMPQTYGELMRIQRQYAARQEADMAAWRSRRAPQT